MRAISPEMPATQVEVSVLIVCYKAKPFIEDCLSGLYAHTSSIGIEVLLVDCSDDGTVELVRARFPQTSVISTVENLGFARGNNLLAQHARGEYLLLLNPDTRIDSDAVGTLVAYARRNPNASGWGGVTVLPDGGIDPSCCQSEPSFLEGLLYTVGLGGWARKGPKRMKGMSAEVPVLSGAFMLVRREQWEELGGFDESFVMFAEELDLCRRLRNTGRPLLMTGDSAVVHLGGSGNKLNPMRILQIARGQMQYALKHASFWGRMGQRANSLLYAGTRVVVGLLPNPMVGQERRRSFRAAFLPILLKPRLWWRGWRGQSL